MKYHRKPEIIEAITFDELVQHGLNSRCVLQNGVPWSFHYHGHPVTHENDDCYIVEVVIGSGFMTRDDMLCKNEHGLFIMPIRFFSEMYEEAD